MLSPKFPYLENQIILSSDRIMLHSKKDAIFLFGRAAVSLSSPATINLDSKESVLINSPKILLGDKADSAGSPVVLGIELTLILIELLSEITLAGMLMAQSSESNVPASMQAIAAAGQALAKEAARITNVLGLTPETNPIMSKVTKSI